MDNGSYFSTEEQKLVQQIRNLENKLDKANMKSAETWHIGHTYEAIRDKLLEVHLLLLSVEQTHLNAKVFCYQ